MTFNPMADDDSGFMARSREDWREQRVAELTKALEYARTSLALEADENIRLTTRIERLEAALNFVIDGWDNQDINHETYRVEVFKAASDALKQGDTR